MYIGTNDGEAHTRLGCHAKIFEHAHMAVAAADQHYVACYGLSKSLHQVAESRGNPAQSALNAAKPSGRFAVFHQQFFDPATFGLANLGPQAQAVGRRYVEKAL